MIDNTKGIVNLTNPQPARPKLCLGTPNPQSVWGFALVELIVILAILGLLVAFAIPNFSPQVQKNKVKAAKLAADSIRNALDMYAVEFCTYPPQGPYLTSPAQISPFIFPNISGTGTTSFLDALHTTLSAYLVFNPKNSLGGGGWGSYALSSQREGYTLVLRAQDRAQTPVTIVKIYTGLSPDGMTSYVTAVYQGEEVPYP